MIELAITLGLILSLLSYEIFGLAAGGIVVPGYIGLHLSQVDRMAGVLLVSLVTYLIVKVTSYYTFLYGRRQMVVSLLIGALLANFSRQFLTFNVGAATAELTAIGWVVPGLIAHWFGKQGIFKTVCALLVTSVIVRLTVIVLFDGQLFPGG
ncbi:MAG: poly-gamma-glutamate biosynthesis protein PgsC [Bacteroidetes bacterium]|nr:poly-gamma-glutamate biosynthesis protein PgsC [Bacteroidota bacterium]MCW5896655.1 poly-gamma-glutamate biosynthesis protein PgsC [Bacteroidota bacterium]